MDKQHDDQAASVTKHAVILCHPDPESFNASIAQTYCDTVRGFGHRAVVRDLYRLGFDPVLRSGERPSSEAFVPLNDVAAELAVLENTDIIILIYPIWFGTPPAMMKGYVERVLGAGFGHRLMREREGSSVAAGKHLMSISTSGNSIQWIEEQGAWVSLRNVFDIYIANAFSMASNEHLHLSNIVENMSERSGREELYRVTEAATKLCAKMLDFTRKPQGATL